MQLHHQQPIVRVWRALRSILMAWPICWILNNSTRIVSCTQFVSATSSRRFTRRLDHRFLSQSIHSSIYQSSQQLMPKNTGNSTKRQKSSSLIFLWSLRTAFRILSGARRTNQSWSQVRAVQERRKLPRLFSLIWRALIKVLRDQRRIFNNKLAGHQAISHR